METYWSFADIMALPSRYRGQMMNKISGVKPANLIGTKSKEGHTNLAIFNSVLHIGASPPFLGFILRPTTVERHTYDNILETEYYTINQITQDIYKPAHQTSAKYPKEQSEFEAVGLTPYYYRDFYPPFVLESNIKIGLKLEEEYPIKCNDTRMIVGRIEHLILPEKAVQEDGHINQENLGSVAIGGLDTYYKIEELARLPYAQV